MESTLVIKVHYADTLRRFNALVDENGKLELDINGLKEKVTGLFNFPPHADLTLTYVDEDGDVVTLVDNEDLSDVMRQRLKFLRINVQLNNERAGRSYARSSRSSTPMRSPRVQQPLPDLKKVTEILKAVPDSLREALTKQSLDIASKAAATTPLLVDIVESFLKMGLSQLNTGSTSQTAQTGVEVDNPSEDSVPREDGGLREVLPKTTAVDQAVQINPEVAANTERDAGAPFVLSSVDLNLPPSDGDLNGNITVAAPAQLPTGIDRRKAKDVNDNHGGGYVGPVYVSASGTCNEDQPHASSMECPFSGNPVQHDHPSRYRSVKRNPYISTFHKGVQCDGCGAYPIMGPRFKSKVKEDYDLCSICFTARGNVKDYIRLDRPMHYRHHLRPFKGFDNKFWTGPQIASPFIVRDCRTNYSQLKLDSRFIRDVTILDGTIMAPSTPFTKVWRMRNCGSVAWPKGCQLLWIGGEKMCNMESIELEISADGFPVEGELDIAVDFTAPVLSGRYISYWRFATPAGVKFGQRVWVLIQVDGNLKDSSEDLNLNLPPEIISSKTPEITGTGGQPIFDGSFQESRNFGATSEPVKAEAEDQPKEEQAQELNFPINDNLLVGDGASASAPPPPTHWTTPSVSYPIIDLSEVPPAEAPRIPRLDEEIDDGKEAVEQSLLKELEEMGFRQVDLNKEILRLNEYNLEQCVDDLCGVAEWDPILEELQEMGFRDQEVNKKLLKKNNGSIKRVVMDLLTGEKP